MLRIFVLLFVITAGLTYKTGVVAASNDYTLFTDDVYVMSAQDILLTRTLPKPRDGETIVRCTVHAVCYDIFTGKDVGSNNVGDKPGIYLVKEVK